VQTSEKSLIDFIEEPAALQTKIEGRGGQKLTHVAQLGSAESFSEIATKKRCPRLTLHGSGGQQARPRSDMAAVEALFGRAD
jgi:hypothetical protein